LATTTFTDLQTASPEVWAASVIEEAEKQLFWKKFEGPEGSGMPIIRKDSNTSAQKVHVTVVAGLSGTGVSGENTLEGNEEKLTIDEVFYTPEILRHAVRYTKKGKKRVNFDIRMAARNALAKWLRDKLDASMFNTLTAANHPSILYAGDATSTDTIDATDDLTTTLISKAKLVARDNKIRPLVIEGKQYYVMVVHPYQGYNLKQDSVWQQAQREAAERGSNNPLFTGALGYWDGVIIYEADNVPRALNNNTPQVYVGKAVLFGAEAAIRGYVGQPEWIEKDFDYGSQIGIAIEIDYGESRVAVSNIAVNSVLVIAAAENPNS